MYLSSHSREEKITAAGGEPNDKDSPGKALMPHIRDLDSGPITMLKSKTWVSWH